MQLKTYPKYKDSDIQWIGKIPEEWEVHRIKSFIPFVKNGQWGNEPSSNANDIIVLRVADFSEFNFNLNKELTIRNIKDINLRLKEGDLVIEKSGGGEKQLVGRVVQLKNSLKEKKYTYSNFIGKLEINKKMDATFLNFYFKAFYNNKVNYRYIKQTTGIQNIDSASLIQGEYFAYPIDKKYQKSIVSFLNKKILGLDSLIEKDKRLIKFLKEKRIALINHAVTKGLDPNAKMKDSGIEWIGEIPEGWEVKRLKFTSDVYISNVDKKIHSNEEIVFLCNYIDVYKNEFITSNLEFMKSTASIEQIRKLSINKEDVIITKDSETIEEIAIPAFVVEDLDNIVCGYHLSLIRSHKKELSGQYLFRLFQSKKFSEQFSINANGVTRFGISTYPIKNILILLPPLQEQKSITEYLDKQTLKIDLTIQKILKEIELLEEYKKSLIHHAVTGKIDVREAI